jgi:hypothetical protein
MRAEKIKVPPEIALLVELGARLKFAEFAGPDVTTELADSLIDSYGSAKRALRALRFGEVVLEEFPTREGLAVRIKRVSPSA